jgi:tRNA(fMet)-specific endonuclease VapC
MSDSVAEAGGQIRAELERKGTPIGPYDLPIAATALVYDLTLVSRNTREFGRVSNLRVENWEAS